MGEHKIIYIGEEIHKKIEKAIDTLSSAVKLTLGPKGRNVIIKNERDYYLTKDGVSVAKSIYSHDKIEQIVIDLMKDVALMTNKAVGDGTTTAIVIAEKLIKEGLKKIRKGEHPDIIKEELENALEDVLNSLDTYSKEISSKKDLKYIASISANNNLFIGEIVAEAIYNSDKDSVIGFDESTNGKTHLEITSGYTIKDAGYLDPRFLEDSHVVTLDNPKVLLIDDKITSLEGIVGILDLCASKKESLLIVATDFTDNVINILLKNYKTGILKVVPIKTPGIRNEKKDKLSDISAYTGSSIYTKINKYPTLAKVNSVLIAKYSTTIVNTKADVKDSIKRIKKEYENTEAVYSKENLDKRISDLLGKTATIHVGGNSDLEILETIDRVEDAINATKAAKEEGVIPGGGVTLYNISIQNPIRCKILETAIKEPMNIILKNAGITLNKDNIGLGVGYNAKTGEVVDMLKANIIDPVKVTKEAVKNAVAITSMLLTTEALVLNEF